MCSDRRISLTAPRIGTIRRFRSTSGTAATVLFVLYFTLPVWEWLFTKALEPFGEEALAVPAALCVVWLPAVAVFMTEKRPLPADFFLIILYLVLYLCATYCLHPDYAYYYFREEYGLVDYVFLPDNGLYAYFFIRLVNDPVRILRGLRVSGWIVYLYSALRLYVATAKGFWLEEGSYGQEYRSSYNMNYGYTLLLFVCFFLFSAFEKGSLFDFLMAGVGCFMILCGGSRGPFLDIVIFMALYAWLRFRRSRHKLLFLSGLACVGGLAAAFWKRAASQLLLLLDGLGLHSRTLEMILNGTVAQNNGRNVFWDASMQMIKDNPLGYGAMGARHVLCGIHIVGHPHNVLVELTIEYGVVLGPLIMLLMLIASLRIFLRRRDNGWQGVFLIFFANACQLLTSYTYWHSPALWCALAAGVCYFRAERKLR